MRTGFVHGAKVVTAAAIIMFSVFLGFAFSHLAMVRPIGFGLAVGVIVDAVLVRMTLTPAVMHLLGDRAWYIPRWLDRLLPDLDVEGLKLSERLAAGELGRRPPPRRRPTSARSARRLLTARSPAARALSRRGRAGAARSGGGSGR